MEILEIEIKAYCSSTDSVRNSLRSMGAVQGDTVNESDLYFNHPGRDFGRTDEALRIRQSNDRTVLTYKGPKIGERTKTRIERETGVDDFKSLRTILHDLGFRESGNVQKKRETWILEGINVCLDSVEGLGNFVELEKIGTGRETVEKRLFELAAQLGLEQFERRSYLELLLEKNARD